MRQRVRIKQYSVPKEGNSLFENEDKFLPRDLSVGKHGGRVIALSDGATESSFSDRWAEILVHSKWEPLIINASDAELTSWHDSVADAFEGSTDTAALPWYAKAKLAQGAFATLLAVQLSRRQGRSRTWHALAIGDTCLLHIRTDEVETSFPMKCPEDFGTRPQLVATRQAPLQDQVMRDSGQVQVGDYLVAATDALAAWLLAHRSDKQLVHRLVSCRTQASFAKLVANERNAGKLKNDDTTVIIVRA